MFKSLTKNLTNIFDQLKRKGALTESQIDETMRDIRIALLEADTSLIVVKDFINMVKEKAKGQEIIKSISPAQMVIKIIHDSLIEILSSSSSEQELNLKVNFPASVLMVGLQGSGKTTASAKLALKLTKENKKVLLVSLDIYRPAAQKQLEILANSEKIDSLEIILGQNPIEIAARGAEYAKLKGYDVVIYDSAGRLHIDNQLMHELIEVKSRINPSEILLVVDSLIGQDAVNVAKSFNEQLNITGIILTRLDADSRGGAALSIKHVIKKPIKFLSSGEKLDSLEEFNAEQIASRILDMGDVLSLVKRAASLADSEETAKMAAKMQKGSFDLNDYINQLKNIKKLGGITSILGMLPGAGKMLSEIDQSKIDEKLFIKHEAIVLSMTLKERIKPEILNASRRKRIAQGSGTSVQDVNILVKQFMQIKDMMKKMSRLSPKNLMKNALGKFFS